ncbi:MAG: TlyA family RNA methyltransferase [Clostridia bacterium]|nr:TlyA family RNA methyltransferase [Clostridia bacterium]
MRIDLLLYENGLFPSRNKAKEKVLRGEVLYKGKPCKPSDDITSLSEVEIIESENNFVSNGGYKLNKALIYFNLKFDGLTFVDLGASNGGFTDVLLKNNAKKVYAVDVGESQLDCSLKNDKRVVVLDNTNARDVSEKTFGELVDGVVCDVSFISLTLILENVKQILKDDGFAVLLIKPQFECGKKALSKNGIVTDITARLKCVTNIIEFAKNLGLYAINLTTAPIKEKKNVEYLVLLSKDKSKNTIQQSTIKKVVLKGE